MKLSVMEINCKNL